MKQFSLIGNPNCGKTSLFNALTGDRQSVGNWPGVTVEKKQGEFSLAGERVQLIDLPGVYSLTSSQESSQDERIAQEALIFSEIDAIINVIDACHLERNLYLTSQLLELGKPLIVVLNMTDIAKLRGIQIDNTLLAELLGCPVVSIQAHKALGLDTLKQALLALNKPSIPLKLAYPAALKEEFNKISKALDSQDSPPNRTFFLASRILEGDERLMQGFNLDKIGLQDADILFADLRYRAIHTMVTQVQRKKTDASLHFTAKLDRIVLHRFWALPIFLAVMYCMFLFAINLGGVFQDFFDISSNAIFVQGFASLLGLLQAPGWLIAILAHGMGAGINTTLSFIPVIASMYFFLSLLETSGYMARAAFVVDKLMRILGLPGKSFVPMIVGFGCNVPAIMAARTLDSKRDRLLTILMSPFMSCSARLAIYAVFVSAFFPSAGQNMVFSLYLIGILAAVGTGFLLRKTLLIGEPSPLIIELPAYHKPAWQRIFRESFLRLRFFIVRAAKLIIPVSMILGALNALTLQGGISSNPADTTSILSLLGQWMTPLFAPMGIKPDNWPATVGLLTGLLAKEVVIGTLNSLYSQLGHLTTSTAANFDFWGSMQSAVLSVKDNFSQLAYAFHNPIAASSPVTELNASVYGIMFQHFGTKVSAYAYLLFILLYVPCLSTMAAIKQEASRKWMWFSFFWSLLVAYTIAVGFYQSATIASHPSASLWILLKLALFFGFSLYLLRTLAFKRGGALVITGS